MLIKDVYKRIENLENDRQNFMRIQEFCLGYYVLPDEDKDAHTRIYGALEDGAMMNIDLRTLASKTIVNINNEIARLRKIIENTHVEID